jgi:hypothetical protein
MNRLPERKYSQEIIEFEEIRYRGTGLLQYFYFHQRAI